MQQTIKDLHKNLVRDDELTFSDDLIPVSNILLHKSASREEKESAINSWFSRQQPCLFGRIAAARRRIHYCFLDESDLVSRDDEFIRRKIKSELSLWKHRSLEGLSDEVKHGFVLVASSESLFTARPDEHLREFSMHLRNLWTSDIEIDLENDVASESLFLRNPIDDYYYRFRFSIDYFAAAGDQRWWHDHRFPAGVGFTANSLGHMVAFDNWYGTGRENLNWALKTAMETIAHAARVPTHGQATWLLPVVSEKPRRTLACPFSSSNRLHADAAGKDWTAYGGHLHTDHSIRKEFFDGSDGPSTKATPYAMDFAYIYNRPDPDHIEFIAGNRYAKTLIDLEIGDASVRRYLDNTLIERSDAESEYIEANLRLCDAWNLSPGELAELLEPPI